MNYYKKLNLLYLYLSLFVLAGCQSADKIVSGEMQAPPESQLTMAVENRVVENQPVENQSLKNQEPHKRVLASLENSTSVHPKRIDIHPVAALYNREAIIPPMCYTRTEGKNNPCYVCHQDKIHDRENVMNDKDLQEAYSFSELGKKNHWQNLFENRENRIAKISDSAILAWVDTDNYSTLEARLDQAGFKGWKPDLKNLQLSEGAFDEEGFAKDGTHWVTYNYKPFPSTFWPTNGSTDDVMIKLPAPYRRSASGQYSRDVYKANLGILEATLKGFKSISTWPIDENKVGVDLDGNGHLNIATQINNVKAYVGEASDYFIASFLFPEGTEFLHTVRYLGVDGDGNIRPSKRMKEVRYMKKWKAYPKGTLARYYEEEAFEKEAGHLPGYTDLQDHGLDNGMGWSVQGFIENKHGDLRVASYEENLFCMGCHNSIGATIDKTFSFARKIDGAKGWGYIDLKGMPDAPNMGELKGEIATYFERAGGGDEFRSNSEMIERWFNADGSVNYSAVDGQDVYTLITPSYERAMQLNKAYKVIVEDQKFIFGRDATVIPPSNVYSAIDEGKAPTLDEEDIYSWDIRLNWGDG